MAVCRACKREVIWGVTAAGKAMPLDKEPNPSGNVWMSGGTAVTTKGLRGPRVEVCGDPGLFADDKTRYMPHFQSCPNVDEFR